MKNLILALFLVFVTFGCCKEEEVQPSETTVESGFENDADGWTIVGDAQGGSNLDASYSPFEGIDNSGYIFADDNVTGGTWYFSAPQKLLGNLSDYFEGTISFSLIQKSARRDQYENRDFVLEGNGSSVYYNHSSYPDTTWTPYSIRIDTRSNWFNESDEPASNSEIKNVLKNVTNLYIRGEFERGPDTGGLDQFVMKKK